MKNGVIENKYFRLIRDQLLMASIVWLFWIFLTTFVVQPFIIPSESMEKTLMVKDRILVNKFDTNPERGDIVVFHDPGNWDPDSTSGGTDSLKKFAQFIKLSTEGKFVVKRVIGLPNDTISCEVGEKVKVNGVSIDEKYVIDDAMPCQYEFSTKVPKDNIWVMGDNRPASADSAYHLATRDGKPYYVPKKNIVGVVFLKFNFDWNAKKNIQYIKNNTNLSKLK